MLEMLTRLHQLWCACKGHNTIKSAVHEGNVARLVLFCEDCGHTSEGWVIR